MSANSGKQAGPPAVSCVIATTPWSGSQLLARALRVTRLAGDPRDYFNPLEVVPRCQEWGLLGPGVYSLPRVAEADFVAHYLKAVAKAATGRNGVLSINLPWSHQRWLVRFARTARPDPPGTVPRSDARVLEEWYPGTRYLYLTCADMAWQAARWYLGRSAPAALGGAPEPGRPPDFQEIRWIETLIARQEQAWECYFEVHGIDAHRIEYEALAENPEETVRGILGWLEPPGSPPPKWQERLPMARAPETVDWLPGYLAERNQLSTEIGVRQERG
jgi:LPS sulfotransferase NodH